MRTLNRLDPVLPVEQMKTYRIAAPLQSHFRDATCEEVDCTHWRNGWQTKVDESTPLGKTQAHYIRNQSGRYFKEDRNQEPGITVFTFEAGQRCFNYASHKVSLNRPALYVVRDGDWRGNPTGNNRRHVNGDDWVDDFRNHQDKIATQIEKG